MKVSQIKANPNNPRTIKDYKFKKLVQSIKEFPEMLEARPIVVNPDMVVLGGNMRLKALKEAQVKEAPVYVATWDEIKQREFIIKDNVGFGEWDWDMLANEWDITSLKDWGLDIPKWEDKEDFGNDVVNTGDYDFPEDAVVGSHVRMVQLFLNTETEPLLKKWELALREVHGTDNLTDTIFNVIKKAYEENQ